MCAVESSGTKNDLFYALYVNSKRGQPPNKGQKARSHGKVCSLFRLYIPERVLKENLKTRSSRTSTFYLYSLEKLDKKRGKNFHYMIYICPRQTTLLQ